MDQQTKNELYKIQVQILKGAFGGLAFVPMDWACPKCHKDLLENTALKELAEMGGLITGCPYCGKSFCD